MSKLSNELKAMARDNGLCDEWYGEWKDYESEDSLIDKYKRGIDFSIQKDWISNEYIKSHFDKEVLHRNNVFVDDKEYVSNPNGVVVINGNSNINIDLSMFDFADIYVRHNSKLHIHTKMCAKAFINVYDNAEVYIESYDSAKVYVYRHSLTTNVSDSGPIKCLLRE